MNALVLKTKILKYITGLALALSVTACASTEGVTRNETLQMAAPLSAPTATAASGQDAFITPKGKTSTPPGATNMCSQYRWACSSKSNGRQDSNAV